MKKLLLKFAALALLALSPHAPGASAQTSTGHMDFQLRTADHNTDLKIIGRYDKDLNYVDETLDWLDNSLYFLTSGSDNATIGQYALTSNTTAKEGYDKYCGIAKLENSDMTIEFDYTNALVNDASTKNLIKNRYTVSTYISKDTTRNGAKHIRVFPGVKIKITPKKNKPISKIKITSFKESNGPNNTTIKYLDFFNKNVTSITPASFTATDAVLQTGTTDPLVNSRTYLTTIQPDEMFGENANEFVFEISKNECVSMYQNSINDTKLQTASTMVTNSNYLQYALSIMAIDIEYFEGEVPAFVNQNVVGLVSDVKYWDKAASKWVVPTKTAFTGETEKFKMGDVITEFRRSEKSKAGMPTVSLKRIGHSYLGAHIGTEFRSYIDPAVTFKGKETPVYQADYYANYNTSSGTYKYPTAYRSSANLNSQQIEGVTFSRQTSYEDPDDAWVFSLESLNGVSHAWVMAQVNNGSYDPFAASVSSTTMANVTNGTLPAVVFEKVVLTAASETKPADYIEKPYVPVAPTIPTPTGGVVQPSGDLSVSEPTDITPTVTTDANFTDEYSDLKFYYIFSETPIEQFDRSKATLLSDGASVKIASKGTLYVVAVGEKDGVEYESLPAAQNFDYFTILPVTSYADLIKPENEGKIVRIDYITKVLNAGALVTDATKNQRNVAYLFDKDGNTFKVTSKAPSGHKNADGSTTLLPNSIKPLTNGNTWPKDEFVRPETVVGKLTFVKGNPVIQIMDRIGEDQFDYYFFNNTTAAAATAAEVGVELSDFQRFYMTDELKPEHWGKIVALNHASAFDRENKTVKENGTGKTVHLVYGLDVRGISNLYSTYANDPVLKAGGADETDIFTVLGVVDYDEETGDFYLNVRSGGAQFEQAIPTGIQAIDGTSALNTSLTQVEAPEGYDFAFEGAITNALNWKFDRTQAEADAKLADAYYYVYDYNDENHKMLGSSSLKVTKTAVATGTYNSYVPTYVDGVANIAIVSRNQNTNAFSGMQPLYETKPVLVKVTDFVRANPVYASIAELRENYKDVNPDDLDDTKIARVETEQPGEMVVVAVGRDFMAARDKEDAAGENIMLFYYDGGISALNQVYRFKSGSNATVRYRAFMAGDPMSKFNGHPTIKDGNFVVDLTGFNLNAMVSGGSTTTEWVGQGVNTPIYASLITDEALTENVDAPETRKLTANDFNHLIILSDLTVKITGDAASEEGETVTATTATPLALTWDYFLTTDEADSHKALVRQASDDAKFTVEGIVLNDGKGGVRLEVLSLSITPDRVNVCYHEGHDSYFTGLEFTDDQADRLVEARGAKLRRTGEEGNYTYLLELNKQVALTWTSEMATQKTAHLKLIEDIIVGQRIKTDEDGNPLSNDSGVGYLIEDIGNFDENPDLSTMMYNISGFLRVAEDGTQTIEVMDLKALNKAAFRTRLFSYGRGSSDIGFGGVSEATITAVTNGNIPTSGAERYQFYYKAVNAPFDEVRRRVDAGETLTEIGAEYLKDAEEKPYDMENKPIFTESYFFSAYACTPGQNVPAEITCSYIEKVPTDVQTLEELCTAKNEHRYLNWTGVTTSSNFLVNNPMRVIGVNNEYGYLAVTDGTAIIGMRTRRTIENELKPGDYIENAYLSRSAWHRNFYNILRDAKDYAVAGSVPENEIAMPEHKVISDFNVEGATAVKIPAARIAKADGEYMVSFAADAAVPAALADEADADVTPSALPITSHLGWLPEDLDEDAEYIVYGIVMPRTTLTDPNAPTYDPETNTEIKEPTPDVTKLELWATSVAERGQTPAPVITVSGAESVEDGKAVTIEDVTVSIACDEATAKIEYSTDGGNTWTAYDDTKPVVIKTTTTVAARAQGEDMSMSPVATMEIVRETISGKAAIDFAPKAGYTEVTLRHEAIDFAGKYEVRYTTDGSEPTADSQLYTAPLELEEACTVKVILKEEGKDRFGAAVSEAITVRSGDLKITATRAPGKTTVRIEVADTKHFNADGAVIYYSKNDGATFDEYQVAGGKNYVEFDTDKAITVVAYLEEQGKTTDTRHYAVEDITVDPVTTEPTEPTDPTDPEDPKDPTEPTDPTDPSDPDDNTDAIDGIAADGAAKVTVEGDCIVAPEGSMVFDLTGRRVRPEGLRAGIYIVRLADGTAVKVAVR